MCTVTFIPSCKGVYLTSNRDEKASRSRALPPKLYATSDCRLIYPRDQDAAGSWIALKENGDAAVLLNGAFKKHQPAPFYRKSRGLIFMEIFQQQDPYFHFTQIDLDAIEPFTLVIFGGGQLRECRWDGSGRHVLLLDGTKPHIWSSATLYDKTAAKDRKRWFFEWFASTSAVSAAKVMNFHRHAGRGDLRNGLLMSRDNEIYTVSITSLFIQERRCRLNYLDLHTGLETKTSFAGLQPAGKENLFQKLYWWFRKMKIRITSWEYWPVHLIYGPLYLYWCWLSLKARSLFFFSAANPGIQNAGFVQERKSDIYKLIPRQYYPRTRLCEPGESVVSLLKALKDEGFSFPLIAKPDVGEKGIQVKLLQSEEELDLYSRRSMVNFLIQEFVSFEQEAGIFYYRMPGEKKGHISGIVGKEFLAVTGDGKSSIRSLLRREDRFLLQLPGLQTIYGAVLDTVLPEGVRHTLVPYGNHSRGAKFIDLQYRITEPLAFTIDHVCKQIPGFYYGRLDIKFNSWEQLTKGEEFSIIELNGAGSEPTHIYDPAHSIFFAWKEICRHWRLLWQISQLNVRRRRLSLMNTAEGLRMINAHFRYLKRVTQNGPAWRR